MLGHLGHRHTLREAKAVGIEATMIAASRRCPMLSLTTGRASVEAVCNDRIAGSGHLALSVLSGHAPYKPMVGNFDDHAPYV
jgi:hypothetical protein